MAALADRVTIDPIRMHGRRCIRGLRITAGDVLGMLAGGMTRDDILSDYPHRENAYIDAV